MSAAPTRSALAPADVAAALRGRSVWAIAAAVLVVVGVAAALQEGGSRSVPQLALAAVAVATLAITMSVALRNDEIMSVAALSLAVTPAALTGVAAGRPWAAVAVVAACGAVVLAWSAAGGWASAIIASSAVAAGVAAWALDTPDGFTSPAWGEAFNRTGQVLWTSVGRVDLAVLVPTTGWLVWWIAAGAVAGAALIVGDTRAAATIPAATATMVAAAWVIIHWRGDVDVAGGLWIPASAVAYAGARRGPGDAGQRRTATALLLVVAYLWIVTLVALARH